MAAAGRADTFAGSAAAPEVLDGGKADEYVDDGLERHREAEDEVD